MSCVALVRWNKVSKVGSSLADLETRNASDLQGIDGGLEISGTGIRRAALTGDVTAAAGSNVTTIPADTVTFAKIQNVASGIVVGRETAGAGDAEEIVGEVVYTGSGHPQGVKAAAVGRVYRDTATGRRYQKMGGGSTAWGWYPILDPFIQFGEPQIIRSGGVPSEVSAQPSTLMPFGRASWSNTIGATATRVFVAGYGFFVDHTTAASIGSASGNNTVFGVIQWLNDEADLVVMVRTGADLTSIRYRVGFSPTATNNDSNANEVMFRFSTAAGDTGWVANTRDGGGSPTITPVAAIAADTIYKLRIRFVRTGTPTAYFSIDDGAEVAVTATLPAAATTLAYMHFVSAVAASARKLGIHSVSMAHW